jgi:hypothetical protein
MIIIRTRHLIFTKVKIAFMMFMLILPIILKAQREEENEREYGGLQFALDFGMYLANKYPANYYNGSDANENNIKYVFGNTTWNNEIKQLLNVSDTSKFFLRECPTNMHYPATPSAGLYISYNFNRSTGLYLQFNYVKLKPHDAFSIEVSPQDEVLTNPDLRLYSISGEEERINIDIGYSKAFQIRNNIDIMGEAGIAVNDIKVLKSSINIENKEYSLINIYGKNSYVPGASQQVYDIYEGGIGIGIHGGAGIKFNFSESFALQPGATLYWNNVNLEGYKDMRFSSFFYLRFIARQLF